MKKTFSFNAIDVFTAAYLAQKTNGSYIKLRLDDNPTNRELLFKFLEDTSKFTKEDYEQGKSIIDYYKGLTFKILKGTQLNTFEKQVLSIVEKETIDSIFDVAIIASLPSSFEKAVKSDRIKERLDEAKGGLISTVGSRVVVSNVEIVKCSFSKVYKVFFVTGITEQNQPLYFSYKNEISPGSVISLSGTIKAHKENRTQLNRVKVLNANSI